MDTKKYFDDIVLPTYGDFERDRSNLRRALLTAMVMYHLLDYVNADKGGTKGSLGTLLERARKDCVYFEPVEALANGIKHVELKKPTYSKPDRTLPDHIEVYSRGAILDRCEIDENTVREFKAGRPMLWFEFKNKKLYIDVVLFAVLNFFCREFHLDGGSNIEDPMLVVYKDLCLPRP